MELLPNLDANSKNNPAEMIVYKWSHELPKFRSWKYFSGAIPRVTTWLPQGSQISTTHVRLAKE